MKINLLYTIVLFFAFSANAFSQEVLQPLNVNASLQAQQKPKESTLKSRASGYKYYFVADTLSIPFRDDFSADWTMPMDTASYPLSAKSWQVTKNFDVDGVKKDSITCRYTKSKTYTHNAAAPLFTDSVEDETNLGTVHFYDDYTKPFAISDTMIAYPVFTRTYFNENGTAKFSYEVKADTTIKLVEDSVRAILESSIKSHWQDHKVYLNDHLALNAPTYGVATFDGVDSTGMPYDWSSQTKHGVADYLTSKAIDLGTNISPTDSSVYFSFFYQPEGIGNKPQEEDSLILEFKSPDRTYWQYAWSSAGKAMLPDSSFQQVIIPVTGIFLKKGFQFRFKNYATLSGNLDHWHIDYIVLDRNRNAADTSYNDRGVQKMDKTFLNGYYVMPYKYLVESPAAYLKDDIKVTLKNLKNEEVYNGDFNFKIFHNYSQVYIDSLGVVDFTALGKKELTCKREGFTFTGVGDPSWFDFKVMYDFTSNTLGDYDIRSNDTVSFNQAFRNYFAREDGSAERGYGITKAGAQFAMMFEVPRQDTLRGITINFIPQLEDVRPNGIKLKVWQDSSGSPGALIYESPDMVYPSYVGYNGFSAYAFDTNAVQATVNGKFHIGFIQATDKMLNVGWDLNTDNSNFVHTNIEGVWNPTVFKGTPMIRPWLGTDVDVSVKENHAFKEFVMYPNPAKDEIAFAFESSKERTVSFSNIQGQILVSQNISGSKATFNTSDISNGVYIVVISEASKVSSAKLIINR